jgi:hypothetical protein
MKWNYRIIDHGEWLGLHEVYYDKQGNPRSYAVEPDVATDKENGISDIVGSLTLMLDAAKSALPMLQSSSFKPHEVEPEVFFADLGKRISELAADRELAPARAIAERVATDLRAEMPDDVIAHLGESHVVFGTACAFAAMKELP